MSEDRTKIILSGVSGRMGRMLAADFLTSSRVQLVGAVDIAQVGTDVGVLIGLPECGVAVSPTLEAAMADEKPDILLDFSTVEAALHNLPAALMSGMHCLVGVTGFTDNDVAKLKTYSDETGNALWIIPNFSLGVNLMFRFARQAAKIFPDFEIVELHHDAKKDAPSGTAMKTARELQECISDARKADDKGNPSRGYCVGGVNVHSIRLPGLLAHQEIIFGGRGEVLTVRHDAMSRECFLPGIYLALEKIIEMKGFRNSIEDLL